MSRFTRNITPLPILPTPGLDHPRFARLRFMTAAAGADGTAGTATGEADAAETGTGSGSTDTTDTTQTGDTGTQAGQGETGEQGDGPWSDPAKAKAEIEKLRRENAAARTNAKKTAAQEARESVLQEFGKALGFIKDADSATPDADALTKAAQDATAGERAARVELAVHQRAAGQQADASALLDSRAFLEKVADLDPKAEDFTTQVDAAIKAALKTNPKLRAQAAGASSVDHAGGSGEKTVRKPKSLTDAVAGKYGTA